MRPQGATSGLRVGGEEISVTYRLNNNGLLGLELHNQLSYTSSPPNTANTWHPRSFVAVALATTVSRLSKLSALLQEGLQRTVVGPTVSPYLGQWAQA